MTNDYHSVKIGLYYLSPMISLLFFTKKIGLFNYYL